MITKNTDDEFVRGEIHVNGMENFWTYLKRALKGTQTHVNPEHLHRYVQERVFAYNNYNDGRHWAHEDRYAEGLLVGGSHTQS